MKNPRIVITIPEPVNATLKRLSIASKQSVSSIVADLITQVHEPLIRACILLESANSAPQDVREKLQDRLKNTLSDLEELKSEGVKQMDLLTTEMTLDAEQKARV